MTDFFLFAETPRAGHRNYRFLVPAGQNIPPDVLERSAKEARTRDEGADFLAVRRENVKQAISDRTAPETLILVFPAAGAKFTPEGKYRIRKQMNRLLADLETLVLTTDWNREGGQMIVRRRELNLWKDQLESLLPRRQPSKPFPITKIMIASLLVVAVIFGFALFPGVGQFPFPPGRFIENTTGQDDHKLPSYADEWIKQLKLSPEPKTSEALRGEMDERLRVVIDGKDLCDRLEKLNTVLFKEEPTEGRKLESLLGNTELSKELGKLFDKSGKFDPLGLVRDKDFSSKPFAVLFVERGRDDEERSRRVELLRNVVAAAAAVRNKADALSGAPWIEFACDVANYIDDPGRKEWNARFLKENAPHFLTNTDLRLLDLTIRWAAEGRMTERLFGKQPGNPPETVLKSIADSDDSWFKDRFSRKLVEDTFSGQKQITDLAGAMRQFVEAADKITEQLEKDESAASEMNQALKALDNIKQPGDVKEHSSSHVPKSVQDLSRKSSER